MTDRPDRSLSNHEVVTLAVYLLGGACAFIDTEDIAIKANEIAPRRYAWKRYPDQINLELIRVSLSDAKKSAKGSLVLGSGNQGWMLTPNGLAFAQEHIASLESSDLSRNPVSQQEQRQRRVERERLLASEAYRVFVCNGSDEVTPQQAEALFRVDDYVIGKARERKIFRLVNMFGSDPVLGEVVRELAEKVNTT